MLAVVGLGACTEQRDPPVGTPPSARARPGAVGQVGPLPANPTDLQGLVDRHRKRPDLAERPELQPAEVLALIRRGVHDHRVATGWPMIIDRLRVRLDLARRRDHDAYLLFGTWHDSGLQLDAMRRLIGPGGVRDWTAVVIEQFDADLGWDGVAPWLQGGDRDDLAAWNERGDREAFARLRAAQVRDNYTAYKYATLDQVMDLLVAARAADLPVWGCDMPAAMQRRLQHAGLADLTRLRELHCLRATEARLSLMRRRRPLRVAMLWGQDHVAPGGVPAFLDPDVEAVSIYAVGGRPVDHGLAAELGARLAITAPMLIPLDEPPGYVLLLPGRRLAAHVERRRTALVERYAQEPYGGLTVRSTVAGHLQIRLMRARVEGERQIRVAAGQVPFLFTWPGGALAGGVEVPAGGRVDLELDPARRRVEVLAHVPGAQP